MSIIEQRTYILKPEYSPSDYFSIYKEKGLNIQTQYLGELQGYFFTEVGRLNAVTSLWLYESFDDRVQRRLALSKDPAWHSFLADVKPMLEEMSNQILNPASFSPIK